MFQVKTWSNSQKPRTQDIILHKASRPWIPIRHKRDDTEYVKITNLWPYSYINFTVRVLNKFYAGPPSQVGVIETPEGSK